MNYKEVLDTTGRASGAEIEAQAISVMESPVVQGVLHMVGGIVLVINEGRQIVAVNEGFSRMLGLERPEDIFGARPGEAMSCAYAYTDRKGCGESGHCRTCGAVNAVREAFAGGQCSERRVALRVKTEDGHKDMCLHVRAFPIEMASQRYAVVFIQDITLDERKYEMDRMFFHDILNSLTGLVSLSDLIERRASKGLGLEDYPRLIKKMSHHLAGEVRTHRCVVNGDCAGLKKNQSIFGIREFVSEIGSFAAYHPSAFERGIALSVRLPEADATLYADEHLLSRVVMNMLINAFEASESGDTVVLECDLAQQGGLSIIVTNPAIIAADNALRIFQRHFSTKQERGRGFGTYGMKLIGEQMLGGRVGFESSADTGTRFHITLPR